MNAHWVRLARWYEDESSTPVTDYKQPLHKLAQRIAAATLLGEDVAAHREAVTSLTTRAKGVVDWGNLAAAELLMSGAPGDSARLCAEAYMADPDGGATEAVRAHHDEVAVAVGLLIGNGELVMAARQRRRGRELERPTAMTAEAWFLAGEVESAADGGDVTLFSAVRGVHRAILVGLERSVAPFVCALAAAGAPVRERLHGALGRYDELSFAGPRAPYRLVAKELAVPAGEATVRLVVDVSDDRVPLDVIEAPALVEDLPETLAALRRELDDAARRRFDKQRHSPGAVLEIVVRGAPRARSPEVLGRRVAAALALLGPSGYAMSEARAVVEAR
jgi:hypothetical protein